MTTRYVLRVKASNLRCELRVNDVPVGLFAPGEAEGGAEVPVNEFLLAGGNTLGAVVHAHPRPSRVLQAWDSQPGVTLGAPASFQAELVREDNAAPSPGFQPLRLHWQGPAVAVPQALGQAFSAAVPTPAWAWSQATELPADGLAAAGAALQKLAAVLQQKDLDTVERLMAVKLGEITQGAYGVDPGPLRAAFRRGLQRCFTEPGWSLLPLGPDDLDLRLVARRRLVECLRPDGRHALTYSKEGSRQTFFLPVMLGLWQGRWQILR
jgi:hypothetical protein